MTLPIHPGEAVGNGAGDQAKSIINQEVHDKVVRILAMLTTPLKRGDILHELGLKNHTDARKKYIDPLLKFGWIEMTLPESPTHPDQRYHISDKGKKLLNLLTNDE